MLELIELTFATTGANFARLGPGFGATEVGIPERPRPALPGSLLVDLTFARFVIEKYAVAILVFDQTPTDADWPHVLFLECPALHPQSFGQGVDLGLIDPHIAGRTGAAVATRRALEA